MYGDLPATERQCAALLALGVTAPGDLTRAAADGLIRSHGRAMERAMQRRHAVVTPEMVRQIRTLRAAGQTLKEIEAVTHVSITTISHIARGKRWADVR